MNQIGGSIIRAKVELELAEIKKFTEKVIHSMSEGISILDINGVHIDVNQSLCQMTGYSREELIGSGMPHLYWPEEDYEKLRTEFERGLQGVLKETELIFKRKNGERFPVIINPSTLTDDDGNINIFYSTIKDITESKKATENLQKSEQKYRSIIENAVEGIILLDSKGNFTEINDSLIEISNYRREELIGKNFIKLLPLVNIDIKKALSLFKDIMQGIIPETNEWTIKNKKGEELTFLAHCSPIRINNQVEGISIILEDITARKESARFIEENEEKYRTLFESNPNYTIIINLEGKLIGVNRAAQKITGLSREELVGKHFSQLRIFPEEELEQQKDNFYKLIQQGYFEPYEGRIIDSAGNIRWVLNTFTVVKKNNKMDYIIIMGNDITEMKDAEELTQKHLKKLSILNQVINMVNSVSHLDDLYREILNSTKDLLGYDGGCIYLLEENQQYSKLVYHENYPMEFINKYKRIKLEEIPTYSQLYTNKKPMYFDFTEENILRTGFRAVAIVPLFSKGEVIGSINVSSSSKHYFSELEKEIIESIGMETGTVITKMFSEEQIKESLNEKELLLKEIHHRVKNNLQIISSLLDLQVDYVKEDQTAVNVLRESRNRVLSMAMIHEMIYQSEDLSHINFSDYIRNLTSNLFNSYGVGPHISSVIEVDQVSLNIETSIPLGMITSEIVSNSLKYAFNDQKSGEIYINLRDKGENYQLIISDNGVGLPQSIDINNEKTLGLRLIHSLVSQIDGTVELDRTEGTKFDIKFKELTYKKRY